MLRHVSLPGEKEETQAAEKDSHKARGVFFHETKHCEPCVGRYCRIGDYYDRENNPNNGEAYPGTEYSLFDYGKEKYGRKGVKTEHP